MTAEMRCTPANWKMALESTDADKITAGFSMMVGEIAGKISKNDRSALQSIDELYQATINDAPSTNTSQVTTTCIETAKQLVKGLHLAVHGFFEYEQIESSPEISYNREFTKMQGACQAGDIKNAEELFKKLSSLILHSRLHVNSYQELLLDTKVIQLELRDWASALGMLKRNAL